MRSVASKMTALLQAAAEVHTTAQGVQATTIAHEEVVVDETIIQITPPAVAAEVAHHQSESDESPCLKKPLQRLVLEA